MNYDSPPQRNIASEHRIKANIKLTCYDDGTCELYSKTKSGETKTTISADQLHRIIQIDNVNKGREQEK